MALAVWLGTLLDFCALSSEGSLCKISPLERWPLLAEAPGQTVKKLSALLYAESEREVKHEPPPEIIQPEMRAKFESAMFFLKSSMLAVPSTLFS